METAIKAHVRVISQFQKSDLNILQDLHVNNQSLLKVKMISIPYFGTRRIRFDYVIALMSL